MSSEQHNLRSRVRSPMIVSQAELFSPTLPEGFRYQPDFLTVQEEAELVDAIHDQKFEAFDFHGYTARRRTIEYGLEYDFRRRQPSPTRPFPHFLLPVRERAAEFAGMSSHNLVEGIIIEYPPGAPMGWHRDAPQFGTVIGISLVNPARMRLKPHSEEGKIVSVTLEPRSIYVLSGPVRWQWQHSILRWKSCVTQSHFARCGLMNRVGRRNGSAFNDVPVYTEGL